MKMNGIIWLMTLFTSCGPQMDRHITNDLRTAHLILIDPPEKYPIEYCTAINEGDSIVISVPDSIMYTTPYTFKLIKQKSGWVAKFAVTQMPTDSSYRQPTYTVLDQNIILNSESDKKGDSLKGMIDLKVAVNHSWAAQFTDTISLSGVIKTIIQ